MNTHKNARLTFARRIEMVRDMTKSGLTPAAAGQAHGVSAPTARKWLGRREHHQLPIVATSGRGNPLKLLAYAVV